MRKPSKKHKSLPLLPLGALAAGFGSGVFAQTPAAAPAPATAASAPAPAGSPATTTEPDATTVLPVVRARARAEPDAKQTLRATTTSIGKGQQELRDVPQSVTVITERLIDDRNLDTLRDALRNTAGISFQAAEGGEEDIRLRGFSLQSSGDIFIDGMRDPAFYDRDSFNWDRLEVLRGSASVLFGRGSTGGAINQVSKQPTLYRGHEVSVTMGSGSYLRATADLNVRTGENAALRVNAMSTVAENYGVPIDKVGFAPAFRWGIGTRDEFSVSYFHLENNNGIHYGLPWLTPGPVNGGNYLWPTDPNSYYGLASDRLDGGTDQTNLVHLHRFEGGGELRTALRAARYERDQRASAIRFAAAAQQPGGLAVNSDTFGDATVLNRSNGTGVQLKVMDLDTRYVQSDYSGKHKWFGIDHSVLAGVDAAHEKFDNKAVAAGSPVLAKPQTRVGTPNDGASIDEDSRLLAVNRTFDVKSVGVYAQDLLQLAPAWKVVAGVRFDRLDGDYHAITAQGQPTMGNPPVPNPCYTPADTRFSRSDSLWSKRVGLLFQPTPQSSYHFSYGTSFNTSGDAYQFDSGTSQTDPEGSRSIELGAKLDSAGGNFTTRLALFHSTKTNERNRDAESVTACNYVLSGQRHAAGFELDLAGRINAAWEVFGSYAFIPVAKVDASSGAAGTEPVGSRPGLTPRHSGTIWTTYKVTQQWRLGGGLTAKSGDKPVGLAAGSPIVAPRYVTADLLAEYTQGDLSFKLNVINVTNKHHADLVYRGHYVPGKARTVQWTTSYRF